MKVEFLIPHLLDIYLHSANIRIDALHIQKIYARHPLPHSIRALSDTLDELKVENMVCRLEFGQLSEIGGPFIVVAGRDEYPFYLVERFDTARQSVGLRTIAGRKVELSFEQFRSVWDGTVLMAEKGEQTHEDSWPVYRVKQGFEFLDHTSKYWLAVLTAALLGIVVLRSPELSDLRYLIKAAGVAVSLLVIVKATFAPHLAQRFCQQGKHTDCNEVFHSAGAKLLGWVSLGELSLAYFATSLLWGVLIAVRQTPTFVLLDTLALVFVLYSLIWQVSHRRWCPLCLAIDGVLVVDFLAELFLWNNFQRIRFLDFYPDLLTYGLLFAAGLLAIRRIVCMAERNRQIPPLESRRERLLSSPELFWQLLAGQPEETVHVNSVPAISNYAEADHTITVIMNPSCPKCARVHETLAKLQDYRIDLVFVVNEGDARSYDAALKMISFGIVNDWEATHRLISQWYATRTLSEELTVHARAESDLTAHLDYCRKIHLEGTPTVLIDNRKLPDLYDIEDLKILM